MNKLTTSQEIAYIYKQILFFLALKAIKMISTYLSQAHQFSFQQDI